MKKTLSIYPVFAALLLAAPLAGAEPEYPSDFEPEVIYQDPSLIGKPAETPAAATATAQPAVAAPAEAAPEYPSDFEPEVIYQDPGLVGKPVEAPAAAAPAAGSDYYLFGGMLLALLGFVVWSSRPAARPWTPR